jgi:hypothetical protein
MSVRYTTGMIPSTMNAKVPLMGPHSRHQNGYAAMATATRIIANPIHQGVIGLRGFDRLVISESPYQFEGYCSAYRNSGSDATTPVGRRGQAAIIPVKLVSFGLAPVKPGAGNPPGRPE